MRCGGQRDSSSGAGNISFDGAGSVQCFRCVVVLHRMCLFVEHVVW